MPLQSVIIDANTREYVVQEDVEGGIQGRVLPEILDVRRGELRALLSGQLEQFCSNYSIDVHTNHFVQLTDELPTNAFRYGNQGDPRKKVKVSCRLMYVPDRGVDVALEVEDEGLGIPIDVWNRTEEDVGKLYEEGKIEQGGWGLLILKGISNLTRVGRGNIVRALLQLPMKPKPEKATGLTVDPII